MRALLRKATKSMDGIFIKQKKMNIVQQHPLYLIPYLNHCYCLFVVITIINYNQQLIFPMLNPFPNAHIICKNNKQQIIFQQIHIFFIMQDPITQLKNWYLKLPKFTRGYITSMFTISILITFNIISTVHLYFSPTLVFKHFQLWRLITSFHCYGKLSLNFLFACYFAYFGIAKVELQLFEKKNYADFLILIIYLWIAILIGASILDLPFLGNSFTFALLYIWCRRKPFETIRFFFGLQIKSGYFPLIFMGFNVLMGQSLLVFLLGLGFGHLYLFVKDELTVRYRRDFLGTPIFFTNFVKKYILQNPRRQQEERQVEGVDAPIPGGQVIG